MFGLIRFLTIISILQVTVLGDISKIGNVQMCMEFCSASNSIGSFKDGHCSCENVDNKDAENVFRENRQVENFDPTLYTKDLTDEERTARCTLGSKKHLTHHDGDRVVRYFVNDGPSSGHSYFVGAANSNDDAEKECKSEKNSVTNLYRNSDDANNPVPDEQELELVEDNYYQPDYGDSVVGVPYNPYNPTYFSPVAMNPYGHVMDGTYDPILGSSNYILHQPIDTVRSAVRNRLLRAKLPHKIVRPRTSALRHLSNALLGLVREPVNEGLLGAHSIFHNLIKPDPAAYSSHYINELSNIGRSNVENIIAEANPIVGINNENAQTPKINLEPASDNNTQESSKTKNPTNSVPSIQRANIPTGIFQNTPYNQQYLIPMYPTQNNPTDAFLNSMPRAYILQPVRMPQATRFAPPSELTALAQPQDSSNCENNTSSDNEDKNMDPTNTITEKSKEETSSDTTDSPIIKRDSNKENMTKDKNKIK